MVVDAGQLGIGWNSDSVAGCLLRKRGGDSILIPSRDAIRMLSEIYGGMVIYSDFLGQNLLYINFQRGGDETGLCDQICITAAEVQQLVKGR